MSNLPSLARPSLHRRRDARARRLGDRGSGGAVARADGARRRRGGAGRHRARAAGPVRAVCGKGNNGGDGLVVVRLLHGIGIDAEALLLADPHDLSPDARANHDRLDRDGGAVERDRRRASCRRRSRAPAASSTHCSAPASRERRGRRSTPPSRRSTTSHSQVVAVDVPSGVNASTGEVEGACVRADVTVTFHGAKVGLWVHPGKEHAGRVEAVDIGIPVAWGGAPTPRTAGLIGARALGAPGGARAAVDEVQLRRRAGRGRLDGPDRRGLPDARWGRCARAPGWVRVGVPASLNPIFEVKLTEVMSVPLADENGSLTRGATDAVTGGDRAGRCGGAGTRAGAGDGQLRARASSRRAIEKPLLIDADGLNAMAEAGLEAPAGAMPRPSSPARGRARPPARAALGGGGGPPAGRGPRGGRALGRDRRAEGGRHARGRARRAPASAWAAARGSRQRVRATS